MSMNIIKPDWLISPEPLRQHNAHRGLEDESKNQIISHFLVNVTAKDTFCLV